MLRIVNKGGGRAILLALRGPEARDIRVPAGGQAQIELAVGRQVQLTESTSGRPTVPLLRSLCLEACLYRKSITVMAARDVDEEAPRATSRPRASQRQPRLAPREAESNDTFARLEAE